MKRQRSLLWGLVCAFALNACATGGIQDRSSSSTEPPTPAPNSAPVVENYSLDLVNAVLWGRTSAEAEALYLQAYGVAKRELGVAIEDRKWTAASEQTGDFSNKPLAIVVDVDETVLDTSDYMLHQIRSGRPFDKLDWNRYVQKENATPLPGALDFLKSAAAMNVTIFYVSNREVYDPAVEASKPEDQRLKSELEATRSNLFKFGFPNTADTSTFLLRDVKRGWKEKSPRRAEIAKTHRIIMLVGDNLYDFMDLAPAEVSREARDRLVEDHQAWLGRRWIVLPNPMYGSWETLFTAGKSGADARRAKLEAIGLPTAAIDAIASGGFEP